MQDARSLTSGHDGAEPAFCATIAAHFVDGGRLLQTWAMKHVAAVCAATAVLVGVVSCGSPAGPASYLGTDHADVVFIQWQAPTSAGHLQGTMTVDRVAGTAPGETVSVNSIPFTGSISGNSVTLTVTVLFVTEHIFGTLSGGRLTIQSTTSNGTIQSGALVQADVSGYNKAVAALHARVRQANLVAARAQDEQAAQNDLARLQGASFSNDLNSLLSDVQQASSDLATLKSDAAQGQGSYCDNVSTVSDDAYSVDDDLYSLSSDLTTLTDDIATVRQDISTVSNDVASLSAAGVPAPLGAASDVTAARRMITEVVATANSYIDRANADDTTAYAIANGLATGACAGQGSGSTTALIKHI